MIAFRVPTFYIASRQEDRQWAKLLADVLIGQGLRCTARWLGVEDLTNIDAEQAEECLVDVASADVFILVNAVGDFRNTTGGHHVEFGYALAVGKPIVILGERRNVFHALRQVQVVSTQLSAREFADVVRSLSGVPPNAAGVAIQVEAARGC